MQQTQVLKQQTWQGFPQLPFETLNENIVHHHLFHFQHKSFLHRSIADIQLTLRKKDALVALDHEFRLGLVLAKQSSLFARFDSTNFFKLKYVYHGVQTGNTKIDFYGGLHGSKTLNDLSFKIGAHAQGERFQSDTRLKIETQPIPKGTLYNRSYGHSGKFTFAFLGVYEFYNLHKGLALQNNCTFGYYPTQNLSLFLRLQNFQFKRDYSPLKGYNQLFDQAYLDVVSQHPRHHFKWGLQLSYTLHGKKIDDIVAVVEYKHRKWEHTYKVKVNQTLSTSFLWTFKTNLIGDHTEHGLTIHSRAIHKNSPWTCGFQTMFNL